MRRSICVFRTLIDVNLKGVWHWAWSDIWNVYLNTIKWNIWNDVLHSMWIKRNELEKREFELENQEQWAKKICAYTFFSNCAERPRSEVANTWWLLATHTLPGRHSSMLYNKSNVTYFIRPFLNDSSVSRIKVCSMNVGSLMFLEFNLV